MQRLALMMLVLLVAGCSSPGTPAGSTPTASPTGATPTGPLAEGAPVLHVGDHWTLLTQSTGSNYTTRATVAAIENHGGFEAYRIESVTEARFEYNSTIRSTQWIRTADLAPLEEQADLYLDTGDTVIRRSQHSTYENPCALLHFPLEVGKAWDVSCNLTSTDQLNRTTSGTDNFTYRVVGREALVVPAGTYDAFVLEATLPDGMVQKVWFSPDGCGYLRTSVGQAPNYTSVMELQAETCG